MTDRERVDIEALCVRLEHHAYQHDILSSPYSEEQTEWANDLRTAITELRTLRALAKRVERAPVMFAGFCPDGRIAAGNDWADADHVRLHMSGFGDDVEQAAITVKRVALVALEDGNGY